jgi:putative nucleotidyltransferase with HDIG domain
MREEKKKASLSQALTSGVNKYGTAIIANLAIALKTSSLYGFAHSNVTTALQELFGFLESFIRIEGDTELSRIDEFLFLNEVRVKVDMGAVQTYQFVVQLMKEREIGAFVFKAGLTKDEVESVIGLLNQPVDNPAKRWQSFQEKYRATRLPNVEITKYVPHEEARQDFTDDQRLIACSTYFRTIQLLDEQLSAIRAKKKANLRRLKRLLQAMVDLTLDEQPTLLALVNIKNFGSFLANHSANVAVLSIALGAKLGFSKKNLGDLGLAALLHDIGKCRADETRYRADFSTLDKQELETFRDHVYGGVDILINQRISDAIVKSMNVVFLHHLRYDGTGYPRSQVVKEQNVFSRVVAVADFYDNKSRPSASGESAWTPDRILRALIDAGGTEFDPLVVKAFSNLMGLYPVGCLVCLDSGDIASVIAPAKDPAHLHRPTVRTFVNRDGERVEKVVDLMERDASGKFKRSIFKLYQQDEVALEMEEFLSVI